MYSDCFLNLKTRSRPAQIQADEKKRFKNNFPGNCPTGIIFKKIIAIIKRVTYFTAEFCCCCCCWLDASHESNASLRRKKINLIFWGVNFGFTCSAPRRIHWSNTRPPILDWLWRSWYSQPVCTMMTPVVLPGLQQRAEGGQRGAQRCRPATNPNFCSKLLQVFGTGREGDFNS